MTYLLVIFLIISSSTFYNVSVLYSSYHFSQDKCVYIFRCQAHLSTNELPFLWLFLFHGFCYSYLHCGLLVFLSCLRTCRASVITWHNPFMKKANKTGLLICRKLNWRVRPRISERLASLRCAAENNLWKCFCCWKLDHDTPSRVICKGLCFHEHITFNCFLRSNIWKSYKATLSAAASSWTAKRSVFFSQMFCTPHD